MFTSVLTKAVVANCVVLVPAAAVGAAGVPVRVGLAKGAFVSNAPCNPFVFAIVKSPSAITACFPDKLTVKPLISVIFRSSVPTVLWIRFSPIKLKLSIAILLCLPTMFVPGADKFLTYFITVF